MATPTETPFDTIESAHDFVRLLSEVVAQAQEEIDNAFKLEENFTSTRHRDTLAIASYNLAKLQVHMRTSGRILNDLRSLRRLLYAERSVRRVKPLEGSHAGELPALPNSLATLKPPMSCPVTALSARKEGPQMLTREKVPA